jgi:hypothetical protein
MMSTQSRSGWKAATRSVVDGFRAFNLFPMGYLAIFGLSALQQLLIGPLSRKPEAELVAADGLLVLVLIPLSFAVMAFSIPILRYFAGGDSTHPYGIGRPFFRLLGWWLLLGVLFFIGALVAAAVIYGLFLISEYLAFAGIVVCIGIFWWVCLRLTTLWPALALDEPAPILKRSFQETKGYVWFFIRAVLSLVVVFLPFAIVFAIPQIFFNGTPDANGVLPPLSITQRLAEAVISGLFGLLSIILIYAFSGRLFRVIRDLD